MMINRSETCATRKLTQCTDFGVSMNAVTSKFYRNPADAPDLTRQEFMARKIVIDQVLDWAEKNPNRRSGDDWAPILYKYEIVKSAAKREACSARDWGHLLFTDMTLSRFLLVMTFPETCNCGNFSHHDYDALTKYQADRFMSLVTYLHGEWDWGNQPQWVRATYVTPVQGHKLSPAFFENLDAPAGDHRLPDAPPIFQVTHDKFAPTLLLSELEKIDNTVARGATESTRRGARAGEEGEGVAPSVRDRVLGTKEDRPEVSKAWRQANARQCAYCEAPKEAKHLMLCSKCKLVYYCGRECRQVPCILKSTLANGDARECRSFPIHRLPNELLDNVMTLSAPSALTDPKAGSGKAHYAYLQRSGARDFPRLLSQLPLTLSRGKPLSLICDLGNMSIVEALSSPPFAGHIQRLRLLSIDIIGYSYTSPVFPLFGKIETPALEVLRIHDTQDTHDSWRSFERQKGIVHCAPLLTEFTLNGFGRGRSYFSLFDCTVFNASEENEWREDGFREVVSETEEEWSEENEEDLTEEDRREIEERRQRRATRPERKAKERAMMGPHHLAELEELHISVADAGEDSYWRDDFGESPDARPAIVKFFDGLTTPSLTALSVVARKGLATSGAAHTSDYVSGTEIEAQEDGNGPFILKPSLKDFVKRSACSIRSLSLTRLFISLPELCSILKLCRHLRSLNLQDPLRFMRSSLIRALAARTDKKGRLLAPSLNHLVIKSIRQNIYSGFTISHVLDMVDARWPPGWSDGGLPARVEVIHCPVSEENKKAPTEARMRSRLAATTARNDLKLVIKELQQSAAVRREIESWDKMETYM
ncbi:hypothetical protein HDZ31DRAFT_47505 [Schizophyllum fasciatum]